MENNIQITQLNPEDFKPQQYNIQDSELIISNFIDTNFNPNTDYIENYVLDSNLKIIFPFSGDDVSVFTQYNVDEDQILLNPVKDLERLLFDNGEYIIGYNFYRKWIGSSPSKKYFISEISSDRTEIRLDSNDIDIEDIIPQVEEFIEYRNNQPHFVDFYLNFGRNKKSIANNINIDNTTTTPTLLIKLYEPLPEEFDLKSTLWVVEEINFPQVYEVNFPFSFEITEDITPISGPNFNLKVKTQNNQTTEEISFNDLFNQDFNSTSKLKNLLNKKGISINIDYEDFSSFVHFSSLKTRLENFLSKVQLLENLDNNITQLEQQNNNDVLNSDINLLKKKKENIIENFDGYETFLYYNTTSDFSYPKNSNNELYQLNSTEVNDWLDTLLPKIETFDNNNSNQLKNTIPQYLREDPENKNYELFIDMVSQHYDTVWVYIKSITNKFNNDNRLDFGISKDLVEEALKEFGVKLYSNNFDVNDLYASFLGINQKGGILPYKDITGSLPADTGSEYVDNLIVSNTSPIALDDYSSRIKKRIYHNLPYLLKSKGTVSGLRALITSYGIPDTILRINEFGGKSKDSLEDKDYSQNIFNYKLNINNVNSSIKIPFSGINPKFNVETPSSILFRYKNEEVNIQNIVQNQTILSIKNASDEIISALVLEYTPPSLSPAHQGDIIADNKFLARVKFIPNYNNLSDFVILNLPVMNGEWWSFYLGIDKNNISLKIGNSKNNIIQYFSEIEKIINNNIEINSNHILLSGNEVSFQEFRYYNITLNNQPFINYILNPLSIEGNTLNSSPEELIFRADLGSTLNTSSLESIHPKSTGSLSYITSSFTNGNGYEIIGNPAFKPNYEEVNYTTTLSGINDVISSNIVVEDLEFPNQPSGSNSDNIVLSPYRSIRQNDLGDNNYTQNINYLEVAFSPTDQINDDINSQLGGVDLGEFLGDPKQYFNKDTSYKTLDILRDEYFKKFTKSTDIKDFIRLIKFFDNSLFKIIEDFTPTRTSLSSGIVVKQHLLERNKYPQPKGSFSNETLETDIKNKQRDVFYKYEGGTGGVFDIYNGLDTSPSASILGLSNKFNLTQSFEEEVENINGILSTVKFGQKEFYNGEFSGSSIQVSQQGINRNCTPYKKFPTSPIQFFPFIYYTDTEFFNGTVTQENWESSLNSPKPTQLWILTKRFPQVPQGVIEVCSLKISREDNNGSDITNFLRDSESIEINFQGFRLLLFINSIEINPNYVLVRVIPRKGTTFINTNVLRDQQAIPERGSENYSLFAFGDYQVFNPSSEGNIQNLEVNSQGKFLKNNNFETQFIQLYNNFTTGSEGVFSNGSEQEIEDQVYENLSLNTEGVYRKGDKSFTPGVFINNFIQFRYGTLNTLDTTSSSFSPLPSGFELENDYFITNNLLSSYNFTTNGKNDGSTYGNVFGHPQLKNNGDVIINLILNNFILNQNNVLLNNSNDIPQNIPNIFKLKILVKYRHGSNILTLWQESFNFGMQPTNGQFSIPLNINEEITHSGNEGGMYFIEYQISITSDFPENYSVVLTYQPNNAIFNITQNVSSEIPTLLNPFLGTFLVERTPNTPLSFGSFINYNAIQIPFENTNDEGLYHFLPFGNTFINPGSVSFLGSISYAPKALPGGSFTGGLNSNTFNLSSNNSNLEGNVYNENGEFGNPPLKVEGNVNLSLKEYGLEYNINYGERNFEWFPLQANSIITTNTNFVGQTEPSEEDSNSFFRQYVEFNRSDIDGVLELDVNGIKGDSGTIPIGISRLIIEIEMIIPQANVGNGVRIAFALRDKNDTTTNIDDLDWDVVNTNFFVGNEINGNVQEIGVQINNTYIINAKLDDLYGFMENKEDKILLLRPEIRTNSNITYNLTKFKVFRPSENQNNDSIIIGGGDNGDGPLEPELTP